VSVDLAQLNWLDWLVLLLLALSAANGTRRGFLIGTLDLVSAAFALGAAFVLERPVADGLVRLLPSVAPALAHIGAFLVLLFVVLAVVDATLGRLVWLAVRALAFGPLGALDRALGVVPGLVRGVVMIALLLLPFALLPVVPSVSDAVQDSSLANRLVLGALQVTPVIEARLGQDLEGGLPGLVVAPPEPQDDTTRPLRAGPVGALEPDPAAEQRMLDLVNAERGRAGWRPLVADERLRAVARAHSLEMFQLDYFSHISPTSGSPFDRMRAGGIAFVVAGENLAYAPNVDVAHQGLMNSPGHRANILRAEFGRVGIGVIRSQFQGSMFTQDFTN
jgi:uncharacterized protein YkwD/uncharacterized membrane protein required for colicin V production